MNLKKLPKRSYKIPTWKTQSEDFRIAADGFRVAVKS